MSNVHVINNSIIRDWTHSNGEHSHSEKLVPITLVISSISNCTSKLNLVKHLKDMTGLSLRESKELVDSCQLHPQIIKINLSIKEIPLYKYLLKGCNVEFDMDDITSLRNKKLISLGLADEGEVLNELIEQDLFDILANRNNLDYLRDLLKSRYSLIPEEKLKPFINPID